MDVGRAGLGVGLVGLVGMVGVLGVVVLVVKRKVINALTAGMRPVKISYTDLGELIAVGTNGTCLRRKTNGIRLKDDSE